MKFCHGPGLSSRRPMQAGALLIFLALALPAPAWAYQELVVVRKSGQASSYVSQSKIGSAAGAACADQSVAFAFTVAPQDGVTSIELERGADSATDVVIDVTLTCSSMQGSAAVPFDALGGTATSGIDYVSTPGIALLNLTEALNSGGAIAPVAASVHVELLDNAQSASQPQTLSIVRRDGSYQGILPDGNPVVGSIPGSNTAIVAITIVGQTSISEATESIVDIDPAADEVSVAVTEFCAEGGGGAGSAGCVATQEAANVAADPDAPSDVRDNASLVLENNLLAIAPDETTSIAFVAPLMATGQLNNLSSRLSQLRSEDQGGTVSADGLTLINNGLPVSLGSLTSLLQAGEDESAENEEQRTLLGGTRLGMWINGTFGGGDRDRDDGNSGFKSDTWDLSSGIDYRFTDRFFAGVALGYSSLSADYSADQGSLDVDALSLFGYAGYSLPNGLSFDGSLSLMNSDYQQKRVIEFYALDASATGFHSLGRDIASGDTTVKQHGANVGMTYTFMREAWTIAPQAQLSVLRTNYGAFQETGPSIFNLGYQERSANSQSFSVGSYFDRAFATSVGTFRPYLRAYYFADSGSSKDLLANFVTANDDGSNTSLMLSIAEPDQRYGTAEIGLGFSRPIGTRTVDFNFGYMQMFSFQDLDRWALRLDVRFPL